MSPGFVGARENPPGSSNESVQHSCDGENVTCNEQLQLESDVEDCSSPLSDHSSPRSVLPPSHHIIRQMMDKDPTFRGNVERLCQELVHVEWTQLQEPPVPTRNRRYHGLPVWITWSFACIIPLVMGIAIRELMYAIEWQQEHESSGNHDLTMGTNDESYMTGGFP